MSQVVVLAGGLATRLKPLSNNTPKILFTISGRPFVDLQLELLKKGNVKKILFCLGHKSEEIIKHLSNLEISDLEIDFSIEDKQLGTAGAICLALPKLDDTFGVIYGDSYLRIDYGALFTEFKKSNKKALMTYIDNVEGKEDSNIRIKNKEIERYKKSNIDFTFRHLDYGFSIFRKEVFLEVPKNKFLDLGIILETLISDGEVYGKEIFTPYFEIGSFEGILNLEKYLRG